MGKEMEKRLSYHKDPLWITKSLHLWVFKKIPPLFSSFILYGITSAIFIITMAKLTNFPFDEILKNPLVYFPAILASSWIWYGPFLIYYFDEHVLYQFWKEVRPILRINDEDFNRFYSEIENSFHKGYWKFSLPLCIIAFFDAIFMINYAKEYFYVKNIYDPFYCSAVILALLMVFLGGFGFCGIYNSIKTIYRLIQLPLQLNPLAPDRFGGLMVFGKLAIKTTLLFSSGSVALPFILQVSFWVGDLGFILGILSACIFIIAVGASFIFPIHSLHKIALHEKLRLLTEVGEQYQSAFNNFKSSLSSKEGNVLKALYIIILRDYLLEIEKMKVYLFDVRVASEFIFSVVFPTLLTLLQIILSLRG
jgi:hypothetical protein